MTENKTFKSAWYQREYTIFTALTFILVLLGFIYQLDVEVVLTYSVYVPFIFGLILMFWYLSRTLTYKLTITATGNITEKGFLRKTRTINIADITELSCHVIWRPAILGSILILKAVNQDYFTPSLINQKYKKFPTMPVSSEVYDAISEIKNDVPKNTDSINKVLETEKGFKKFWWLNIIAYIIVFIVFSRMFKFIYDIKHLGG